MPSIENLKIFPKITPFNSDEIEPRISDYQEPDKESTNTGEEE